MKDRCVTNEQKEEFCKELLEIWKASPELRFGQLLLNSIEGTHIEGLDLQSTTFVGVILRLRELEMDATLAEKERKLYNIEDLELLRGLK